MKKNISFIPMDSALETWLLEKLMKEPPESDCAEDLLSGIRDMLNGEVSSLLLSSSNETEAPVPVPLDGMRLGELEIYPKGRRVIMQGAEDYLLDDSNIMAFIRKLRKKIEPDPDAPKYILTIWGIGYKFNDQL